MLHLLTAAYPEAPASSGHHWLLWAGGGALAVLVGLVLLNLIWRAALLPLTRRTKTTLDLLIVQYSRWPVLLLAASAGGNFVYRAVVESLEESVKAEWAPTLWNRLIAGGLYCIAVLSAFLLAYALVMAICDWYLREVAAKTKTRLDDQMVNLFRRVSKVAVLFLALTVILGHFNVKITALLGAAGVASLAVALAAQETFANMISGFTILVDRPFRIGDRIELPDGTVGDIFEVGLRSTKILTFDNTLVILPNKEISAARITNHSYPDPKFKIRRNYTVAYGSDVAKIKRILVEIAAAHPKVLKDPAPDAYFTDFGDSALVIKLICCVADYKDAFVTTDQLNMEVNRRFAEEGVEIPFPQRDIHIRSGKLA